MKKQKTLHETIVDYINDAAEVYSGAPTEEQKQFINNQVTQYLAAHVKDQFVFYYKLYTIKRKQKDETETT